MRALIFFYPVPVNKFGDACRAYKKLIKPAAERSIDIPENFYRLLNLAGQSHGAVKSAHSIAQAAQWFNGYQAKFPSTYFRT